MSVAMTPLLLTLLLNSSAGSGTHLFRLVDTEERQLPGSLIGASGDRPIVRRLVDDSRPSFAAAVTLVTVGGLLGTAGTGGVGFGLAMLIMSGDSLYSGVAVLLGIMIGAAGVVVLVAGIACAILGVNKFKARAAAADYDALSSGDRRAVADPSSATRAPSQLITLATF